MKTYISIVALTFSVISCATPSDDTETTSDELGTVVFPTSCNEDAAAHARRGLALLHHMTYEYSRQAFEEAAEADRDCAIAYWGQAMTLVHPLWSDPPNEERFAQGVTLLGQARSAGKASEIESAYIEALGAYYDHQWSAVEAPRLASFSEAWSAVHEAFPEDVEAQAFCALAHLGTAKATDKTYSVQLAAGPMAEAVLETVADHPGGHHYTIHAYDYAPLAERAVDVARSYGAIAPHIPHALHMPTHIFTRLGYWDESIDFNIRSADAALRHPAGEALSLHYFHALDYLAYAHLQKGEDAKAEAVQSTLENLEGVAQPHLASAYTFAAVPVRLALERLNWEAAANIAPRIPSDYPWDGVPQSEAISQYAVALGAARTGDLEKARAALNRLRDLEAKQAENSNYWTTQIAIQRTAATAWLQHAEGNTGEALRAAREAAEMEAATDKHPVTPGEVLPASELLGEMLMIEGQPAEALEAFEMSLQRSPNRRNALAGAAQAAEAAGKLDRAEGYYQQLVELTAGADIESEAVADAKAFLADLR